MWILIVTLASAAEERDIRLSLAGVAEVWQDDAIATVYRSGAVFGGAGLLVDVWGPLAAGVDVAYRSLSPSSGDTPTLHLTPITPRVQAGAPFGEDLVGFCGLGAAIVPFTERDESAAVVGTRLGLDVRIGVRWDPGFFHAPMAPSPAIVEAVEAELWLGRRQQRPGMDGLDLSAWRAGFGLVARL